MTQSAAGSVEIETDEQLLAALARLDAGWTAMSPARIRAVLCSDGATVSEKRAKALKAKALQLKGQPSTEAEQRLDAAPAASGGAIDPQRLSASGRDQPATSKSNCAAEDCSSDQAFVRATAT